VDELVVKTPTSSPPLMQACSHHRKETATATALQSSWWDDKAKNEAPFMKPGASIV
jgi:hypothetical protein